MNWTRCKRTRKFTHGLIKPCIFGHNWLWTPEKMRTVQLYTIILSTVHLDIDSNTLCTWIPFNYQPLIWKESGALCIWTQKVATYAHGHKATCCVFGHKKRKLVPVWTESGHCAFGHSGARCLFAYRLIAQCSSLNLFTFLAKSGFSIFYILSFNYFPVV